MAARKTHEQFISEMKEKHGNIQILSQYVNAKTEVKCKCNKCGYEWETKADNLSSGYGCPNCGGSIKCTHEKFLEKMKKINPSIEILSEYKNCHTKVKCRCLKDGYEWEATPSGLLKGKGCHRCANQERYTTESFKEKLKVINPNIEVIGEYVNSRTYIKCRCKICNNEWETKPNSLLDGHGCKKCANRKLHNERAYTEEEYSTILHEKNKTVTYISGYHNMDSNVFVKCNICGYEWDANPYNLLKGHGCPECANNRKITSEEFFDLAQKNNPSIEILSSFTGTENKIKCRCKKCNHEWETKARSIYTGKHGCPQCAGILPLTEQQVKDRLKEQNPNIELIGEYVSASQKALFRCKKCGHQFRSLPHNIIRGHGCPLCHISIGEDKVENFLKENNINYEQQKTFDGCRNIYLLKFDFYLPDINVAIEFDGGQHDEPVKHFGGEEGLKKRKKRDKIKNEYCKENKIKLIRIPHTKIKEIDKILTNELLK